MKKPIGLHTQHRRNKMTKTPYEIRFDLLTMAKDLLDRQYDQSAAIAWQALEKGMETNKTLYKDLEKYIPKMYTPEEITAQAEKLQSFVNKKD
tara:strand:+ start:236 stop:514 length:279 start_codon:yes stop_codon:yes gene_type:complete